MTDFETHPAGTSDLVERLREKQICTGFEQVEPGVIDCVYGSDPVCQDAADRIEQLEAALTRANAATAAAYEVAARLFDDGNSVAGAAIGRCVRALATPDQTAALDKLIEPYVEVLGVVLAWHDKDKHTAGKMTFERSSTFAKVRATLSASKKGGV